MFDAMDARVLRRVACARLYFVAVQNGPPELAANTQYDSAQSTVGIWPLGAAIGVLAGAATAGILVGLGMRHGTAMQPFAGAGRILLVNSTGSYSDPLLVAVGLLMHLVLAAIAGCAALALARRFPTRVLPASLAVAAFAWFASAWVLPESLRAVTEDLSRSEQLLFFSVLGVTLWLGIRLALDAKRG